MSVAATEGLMNVGLERLNNFDVDRLIVRNDRIVSDTRPPWE
jgi:hypothetical protein